MTVPPLFGWEDILAVLGTVIAAAVAFLLIAAVCAAFTGRSEWQAFLAGRSRSVAVDQAESEPPFRSSSAARTRAATAATSPVASTGRSSPPAA